VIVELPPFKKFDERARLALVGKRFDNNKLIGHNEPNLELAVIAQIDPH
jgi:hypothetical protein